MTDSLLDISLKLSYYKEIATLDEAHKICLVQHTETARTYVKKTLSLYNKDVFSTLQTHPLVGLPKIFELFEVDDKLIVIEEYISGITLEKLMDEKGKLSESEVRDYTIKLCDILASLHALNPPVIHRDIKPSNIIITDDNRLVLVDLNGAKRAAPDQTKDTVLIGTQGYAAPEQYGFGASNVQTDLYAVGILMSYLLTGELNQIEQSPKVFKSIIKKCTQLDPQKRYTSAIQVKNALLKSTSIRVRPRAIFSIIAGIIVIIGIIIFCLVLHKPDKSDNIATFLPDNDNIATTEQPTSEVSEPTTITHVITGTTVTDVPATDAPATPTITDILTPDVSMTPSPDLPKAEISDPVGVYEGNDKEKLVIAADGFAYYYCYSEEFTELKCPWTLENNILTITLSVMHCDIAADTSNGYDELIFRSDSLNWNTEVFEKTELNVEDCIMNPPPIINNFVFYMENGQKQIVIDKILFTIPKYYRPLMDNFPTTISFMDDDIHSYTAEGSFVSTISFVLMSNAPWEAFAKDPLETTRAYMSSYMSTIQMGESEKVSVAGRESYMVSFSGLYNEGFSKFANYINEGYLLIIPKKDGNGVLFVQMTQAAGKWRDNDADFHKFVDFAIELVSEE